MQTHSTRTTSDDEHAPPRPPRAEQRTKRAKRASVVFASKPSITATDQGLQLQLSLINRGPSSISGSINVRFNGQSLEVSNPDLSLAVGDGPVNVSYSLAPRSGLTKSSRLQVTVVDKSGTSLAVSTTGVSFGTAVAIGGVSLGVLLGVAGVVDAVIDGEDPPPSTLVAPPTTVTVPVETTAPAAEVVLLSYVADSILTPTEAGPGFYPLGVHDDLRIELGDPIVLGAEAADEYYGTPGGSVVQRTVTARYRDTAIDLGVVTLPEELPVSYAAGIADGEQVSVASVQREAVEFMTGDPLPATCSITGTDEIVGGYRATGSGALIVDFMATGSASGDLAGDVVARWVGDGQLEYFPGVAPTDSEQRCEDVFTDGAFWD